MHAPNQATEVHSTSKQNRRTGACRSGCPSNPNIGWFISFRQVPEYTDAYEAVIELYVQDAQSTYSGHIPFVIDTGTDVTIIPRRLLKRDKAFPRDKARGAFDVRGLAGGIVVGRRFRATVSIDSLDPSFDSLSFGELEPIVVDEWESNYGYLGLDALRNVVMVCDDRHVSLWPKPTNPCEYRTTNN